MAEQGIDVTYVADLARIELTADEKNTFQKQLSDVLHYVEELKKVDTSSVPDTPIDPNLPVNVLRQDELRPSFPVAKVIGNAPVHANELITVPKIVE
jgi:aspartyl-tRNA(Asn)/glutamyl-tRNA(Gln) amidotransferase subunit C